MGSAMSRLYGRSESRGCNPAIISEPSWQSTNVETEIKAEMFSSSLDSRASDHVSSTVSASEDEPLFSLAADVVSGTPTFSEPREDPAGIPGLEWFAIYQRLTDLYGNTVENRGPIRICVKGLDDGVRRDVGLIAKLAGFKHVREAKEKNLWLGREGTGFAVDSDSAGEVKESARNEEAVRRLMEMTGAELRAMDTAVCDGIRAYLRTWMKEVSRTFDKSTSACTSLETDCFLRNRDWVEKQAKNIASQVGLVVIPTPSGHLKVQKASQSVNNSGSGRGVADISNGTASSGQRSAGGSQTGTRSERQVLRRLQEAYDSRPKEQTFRLEITRSDVRVKIVSLAKAAGFFSAKITPKGKLVVVRNDDEQESSRGQKLGQWRAEQLRDIDGHVQRGIKSYILNWFAAFEKNNLTKKSLSTGTFLISSDWVQEQAVAVATSVGLFAEVKQNGSLEVARNVICGLRTLPPASTVQESEGATDAVTTRPITTPSGGSRESRAADVGNGSGASPGSCSANGSAGADQPPRPPPLTPDQVAVWNQLKTLLKSKQAVHIVWASGLEKKTRKTICDVALRLGFGSATEAGAYIKLARAGGVQGPQGGCKLGKLPENLRNEVITLDEIVTPAVESSIKRRLSDFCASNDTENTLCAGSYPLPPFKVSRMIEDEAKELHLQVSRKSNLSNIVVVKKNKQSARVAAIKPSRPHVPPSPAQSTSSSFFVQDPCISSWSQSLALRLEERVARVQYPSQGLAGAPHLTGFPRNGTGYGLVDSGLPLLMLGGPVHYVYTKEMVNHWCLVISSLDVDVIGIDTEWKPNFFDHQNHAAALVQVCFKWPVDSPKRGAWDGDYVCVLFHIFHSGMTPQLKELLENPAIAKVGVQIDSDVRKVWNDHGVEIVNPIELYQMASAHRKLEARGLKGLVAGILGKELPKNKRVTLSNWEQMPLSEEQKTYAALDAYAALRIHEELVKPSFK